MKTEEKKRINRTLHDITDPPEGMCWKCPDCDTWASLSENARFHVVKYNHGLPTLVPIPRTPTPPKVRDVNRSIAARSEWLKKVRGK